MKKSKRKTAARRILDEILDHKMSAYSATAAAALLAGGASARAAVHVTDVNVVLTGPFESYSVDLNGDADADLKIQLSSGNTSSVGVPFSRGGTSGSPSSYYYYSNTIWRGITDYFRRQWNFLSATIIGPGAVGRQALSVSDSVNTNNSWVGFGRIAWHFSGSRKSTITWTGTHSSASNENGDETSIVIGPYFWNTAEGNFIGQSDKYLGVRFKIGDDIHFGWVQVDVNADASQATIDSYGYQDIPGAAAHATAVPEPGSLALLAIGAAGLAARRRKKAAA